MLRTLHRPLWRFEYESSMFPRTPFIHFAFVLGLVALLVACGDDDPRTDITDASGDMVADGDVTDTRDTADVADTSDTADVADTTDAGDTADMVDMSVEEPEFATLIIGMLADTPANSQPGHDGLAAGGEESARMLGDFGHDALLGTTLLGTTEDEFLGLDRWTDATNMAAFYANPDFAMAFGMLFSEMPDVTAWNRTGWHQWGDLNSGDVDPNTGDAGDYWFVVARGRLTDSEPMVNQMRHDAIASGGEESLTGFGNVAHIVFVGLEDPREFLSIDVWNRDVAIEAIYTEPAFVAGLAGLLEVPTLTVYHSTDWHQW